MYLKLLQDGHIDVMYVSPGICTEGKTVLQLAILPWVCVDCFDLFRPWENTQDSASEIPALGRTWEKQSYTIKEHRHKEGYSPV